MDGILLINKPLGYTSRDVVNVVGKMLGTKKIGHTGTLDPNADGVMVLCVGKALKICEMLTNHDKEYQAEVILGIATDTLDMDVNSTVINDTVVDIDDNIITEVVNSFIGKYMQEVPIYSSVKVNGKKLYQYARNNIPVKLPKKEVDIKNIKILDKPIRKEGKIYFTIELTVGKGTYVRALVRDIGLKLGVPAVMNKLTRTKLGNYELIDCNSFEDVLNNNFKIISITDALNSIPVLKVDSKIAFKIKNGVSLDNLFKDEMSFIVDDNNNLLALYKNIDGVCRPYKMFV